MIQKLIGLSLFLIFYVTVLADELTNISELIKKEKWVEAEKELKSNLNQSNSEDSDWLYTSLIYVLNSQSKEMEAIQIGRGAIKTYPNSNAIKEALSHTLIKRCSTAIESESNLKEALSLSEEAYKLIPNETNSIWYGIALTKNKKFKDSVDLFLKAKTAFPNQKAILKNLAYSQFEYGLDLLNQKEFAEAEKYLKQSYESENKDYILYQLAIAMREQKKYNQAIELLVEGISKFPTNEILRNTLPYTRFLNFNDQLSNKTEKVMIKKEVLETINLLRKDTKFKDQYYYQRIILKGTEYVGDVDFHALVFKKLLKLYPDEPDVYDQYGFTYYTMKSKDGQPSKADRTIAIELRKKAFELYERQNPNRKEILNVSYPIIGRYEIIAEFGGSAMTHNGLAKYCYDFVAVDASGDYVKKGKTGKSNDDYYNFNQPLYAVEDGEVIDLHFDLPDNEPGKYANNGNYISINHSDFISFYAHLKKESSVLKIGQKVKKGDLIGKAGNSGMSRESHLHFCLNDSNWVSLPFRFKEHKIWKGNQFRLTTDPIHEGEIVEFNSPN